MNNYEITGQDDQESEQEEDELNFEEEFEEDELDLSLLPHVNVSYPSLPSRATLFDWKHDQFVLLKARSGAIYPSNIRNTIHIVERVAELSVTLNNSITDSESEIQYLKLRGIWFDNLYGGMTIFVQLLHDTTRKPRLTATQIKQALHDGSVVFEGITISIEVNIEPARITADDFYAVSDEFYKQVQKNLTW